MTFVTPFSGSTSLLLDLPEAYTLKRPSLEGGTRRVAARASTLSRFRAREESIMSLYTLLLFVHVSGAIGLFTGMGIWLFGITAIGRAAQVEQVRTLADLMLMAR